MPTLAPAPTCAFSPDRPAATRCAECGYLRHGLASAARCPECGVDPAEPDPHRRAIASTDDAAGHARAIAAGLALLLWSSLTLLGVTLAMHFRDGIGGSLPVVNFPGPKVWAAALVQRSIGNLPGFWGVSGMVAALQAAIAIWLVTVPRRALAGGEPHRERWLSRRRLARVGGVGLLGAGFGLCVSEAGLLWFGSDRDVYFAALVTAIELPATALLYLHLVTLARRDAIARNGLVACAFVVPILMGVAAWALWQPTRTGWTPRVAPPSEQAAVALYGAAAVLTALVAYAAIVRLAWQHAVAGFGEMNLPAALARVADVMRPALAVARRDAAALAVALGCVVWLKLTFDQFARTAWLEPRVSTLGDLPFFNFPGPKAFGAFLGYDGGGRVGSVDGGFPPISVGMLLHTGLVATWLLTMRIGNASSPLRAIARWWPTLACGALIGIGLAFGSLDNGSWISLSRQSKFLLLATAVLEVPATLLIYGHLARVAAERGSVPIARGLAIAGVTATLLMVACLAIAATTAWVAPGDAHGWLGWIDRRNGTTWFVTAAVVGAAAFAAGAHATWQVARLTALLVRPTLRRLAGGGAPVTDGGRPW